MDAVLIKELNQCIDRGLEVALVTVISKLGSGPRDIGSMMIVDKAGHLIAGTIGGGTVEETAKKDAALCIAENKSNLFQYELTQKEVPNALGMVCGGTMDVFIKVFVSKEPLIIFGGGHIGLELSHFATRLGYDVTVIDHREAYYSEERFPEAKRRLSMNDFLKSPFDIPAHASIVIVTHGHTYDLEALSAVVNSPTRYIGVIGSRNKLNFCFETLRKQGVSEDRIRFIHAPIGLDIGGETPCEIALAILSEIQAVKYNCSGGFLKTVKGNANG